MGSCEVQLTCILGLQVEKPGEGQPLHLPWGQDIVPEDGKREVTGREDTAGLRLDWVLARPCLCEE